MNVNVGPALIDDIRRLLQSLPRCIHGSSRGLTNRCTNVGLYVVVDEDASKNYGVQVCRFHKQYLEAYAKSQGSHMQFQLLRYAEPAEALAKKFNIPLKTDVGATGVVEEVA